MPSLTEEQSAIVNSKARRLAVHAFAGTGKTYTAEAYTRARPTTRFLYIVFNKSAEMEAKARFGRNVTVKTGHSVAFGEVGFLYKHKLSQGLRLGEVRDAIDPANMLSYGNITLIMQTLQNYLVSADKKILADHVPPVESKRDALAVGDYIAKTRQLWHAMCDVENTEVGMTHDGYLKIYQCRGRPLSERFDALIVDEAQDLNPVMAAIVDRQDMPVLLIGDSHQQIYAFRGAIDALDSFEADEVLPLTLSFRFGPAVAVMANAILLNYKGDMEHFLIGDGPDTRIAPLPDDGAPFTKLHRTFAETFSTALLAAVSGKKTGWIGGIKAYPLESIRDLHFLSMGQDARVRDRRLLRDYPTYEDYKAVAEAAEDREMLRMVKIVEEYGASLPRLLDQVRSLAVPMEEADITVGTAHRAKGLQWPRVMLADDFEDLQDPKLTGIDRTQAINLLYVAVTRAEHILDVSPEIQAMAFLDGADATSGNAAAIA